MPRPERRSAECCWTCHHGYPLDGVASARLECRLPGPPPTVRVVGFLQKLVVDEVDNSTYPSDVCAAYLRHAIPAVGGA